ncbi:hypothetical protein Tco_0056401, partial [Tanacetum coccineum]
FVMSDSEHSTVTYTSIFSDDGSLDIGSPGVIEPPLLDFIPKLVYLEFMPLEDDVFPTEEQPLPVAVSPTADSPDYITKSDLKEDLEEEDDEDPEEDPADYPTDRDDDDEEEESFIDDADNTEEDEDEEEEDLAPADSVPPPVYRTIARMSIRAQTPIPFLFEAKFDKLLAIS